ncbi:DUF3515 domain-containing protein [Streptomyces sp. S1A]|uniref:DUF3515 domain-containing protein n=1 Tax=Streptomyces chitinivorans TaxID=1257027 RepID=A0ABW7HYQ4_9ACTN|nr:MULTISPECIES: DUF3515 domain-containing protein [Streptomyces]MCG3040873.1 DUF3515 domain-containing protein [Streptomyces sp. ICN903]MDH2409579.1 DUF3515 domain-containing protein [Streptomyces chitinivorans]
MSSVSRRSLPSALRTPAVVLAVLAAAAGCTPSGGDRSGPPVPSPTGEAADVCRELYGALPEEVDGQPRGEIEPETRFAAVWGDPAIELGCGVPRPEVLTPGSEHYNPTSESVEVNGVSWLLEEQGGGHRFTLLEREVFVRVTVPDAYAPEVNALVDLADAVRETVPEKPL